MTTTTDKRYRVLSLTNIGRALVEEMIATDDEGDARRFLRASAFPAAIVEGRRVTASNKRGADYEDAFEAFARSGPAVLVARPVAAKSVKPVEMPAREPTRAPDEPVNAREIARRAVVANPPVSPVGSIEAPAANGSISSKSSPAVEAPPEPVSAADEFEPAAPASAPLCTRPGCGEPQAPWMDKCHPAMRVLCREDRARAMRVRVRKNLTAEEAVAYVFTAARLAASESAEEPAVEASATATAPAPVEAEQPAPALVEPIVEPLVACDGDCDGGGHGDAPAAPLSVVAEGEPSATTPPSDPLTEPRRWAFALDVPPAPGFTLDDVRRVVREELCVLLAPLFAGVGL